MTNQYETVAAPAPDEGTFEAYCAVPERGTGPGMLLFQETSCVRRCHAQPRRRAWARCGRVVLRLPRERPAAARRRARVPHPLPLRRRRPVPPQHKIADVEAALGAKPNVEIHHYAAGHAFSNWDAPSMYQQEAADLAWSRSLAFLAATLT